MIGRGGERGSGISVLVAWHDDDDDDDDDDDKKKSWEISGSCWKVKKKTHWNMKITIIPIIVRALWTIPRTEKKEWRKYESKEVLRLFRSHHSWNQQEYLEEFWWAGEICCHLISIIVGKRGTVLKGLEKRLAELEIRGRIKTIQTTSLLR